jgi:hypothetical protein
MIVVVGKNALTPHTVQQLWLLQKKQKIFIIKTTWSQTYKIFVQFSTILLIKNVFFSRFLEPGSYPVVSPDGGRFPEFMSVPKHAHNLTFRPENGRHSLLVTSPVPGEWYMLAYINRQQKKDFVQQVIK